MFVCVCSVISLLSNFEVGQFGSCGLRPIADRAGLYFSRSLAKCAAGAHFGISEIFCCRRLDMIVPLGLSSNARMFFGSWEGLRIWVWLMDMEKRAFCATTIEGTRLFPPSTRSATSFVGYNNASRISTLIRLALPHAWRNYASH